MKLMIYVLFFCLFLTTTHWAQQSGESNLSFPDLQHEETIEERTETIILTSYGEFIELRRISGNRVLWRIANKSGNSVNSGEIREAKNSLKSVLLKTKNATDNSLDKNPKIDTGIYSLIYIDENGDVSLLGKRDRAMQQSLVLNNYLSPIRVLPYMDGKGGGAGAFYPMFARFAGPMALGKPSKKRIQSSIPPMGK